MKNDSKLQAIIDAAIEWVDVDQDDRSFIMLAHNESGDRRNAAYSNAGISDIKSMLYSAFKDNHNFLCAAKEVIEWVERDKNAEPATFE